MFCIRMVSWKMSDDKRILEFDINQLKTFDYNKLTVFYDGKMILGIDKVILSVYKFNDVNIGNEALIRDYEKSLVDTI